MAMAMAETNISPCTQEPAKLLVFVQKRLPATGKRSRAKRSLKSNTKSTDVRQDPRALDYSDKEAHPGVLDKEIEASNPGKQDVESTLNWEEFLELPPQDGESSNVENFELPFYDNTKWALPESWAMEASEYQGGMDVLLTETELIGLTEQKQEQRDLATWNLEDTTDGKNSCSMDMGFAKLPNISKISSNQEDLPSRKRKSTPSNIKKKEIHILIERERRKWMNDLFATVRSLLPEPSAKKDKATLLSDFIEHIRAYQQKVEGLKQKRANIAALKSSSQKQDSPEKKAGTHTTSNSQIPAIASPLLQAKVAPYVRVHRSGQDTHVTVTCTKNSRISFSILKVMIEHQLQLVNVQISSNGDMLVHNLRCKVTNGSSFCKDDLHSELQKMLDC